MGLFESVSKFLSLINRDESNHLGATIQMIKNWSKGKDGKEWKEIWHDNKHKIKEMYLDGLQEECKWSAYLFKYGTPIKKWQLLLLHKKLKLWHILKILLIS
jgi:ribonucleotide reductase beta subunit family protein with ferritin-like domain